MKTTTTPDLTGRTAKCSCGRTTPSRNDGWLFGFEFWGEGSAFATEHCGNCGYHLVAHQKEGVAMNVDKRTVIERGKCTGFVPKGAQPHDSYYCGHSGWD